MNTNIDARIAQAEAELKKAKASAIVYKQIESAFHCNYCDFVRDEDGKIIEDENGNWNYVEQNADAVSLYDYDYNPDIYNVAKATMKKVLENVIKM